VREGEGEVYNTHRQHKTIFFILPCASRKAKHCAYYYYITINMHECACCTFSF
jgi:hypothetical protein